jgi:uncharacterized cupin superfamily protein
MFTGPDGQTHFGELDIPASFAADSGREATQPLPSIGAGLAEATVARDQLDYHNAPRRQMVAVLTGGIEITTGDGTTKQFRPGDIFLADDLTGQGHKTRDLAVPTRVLYVFMELEFDVGAWG